MAARRAAVASEALRAAMVAGSEVAAREAGREGVAMAEEATVAEAATAVGVASRAAGVTTVVMGEGMVALMGEAVRVEGRAAVKVAMAEAAKAAARAAAARARAAVARAKVAARAAAARAAVAMEAAEEGVSGTRRQRRLWNLNKPHRSRPHSERCHR